jgi:DNA-binding PadR family transcriptional regulator
MKVSSSEVVILGIIHRGVNHGYDIEKFIQQEDMREWTSIGFSSIYYILNKLEKKELISSELITTDSNKTRKIYNLSTEGKQVLIENVFILLSDSENVVFPFDIGLFFKDILAIEQQLEAIELNIIKLEKELVKSKQLLADSSSDIDKLIFKRGVSFFEAEIKYMHDLKMMVDRKQDV